MTIEEFEVEIIDSLLLKIGTLLSILFILRLEIDFNIWRTLPRGIIGPLDDDKSFSFFKHFVTLLSTSSFVPWPADASSELGTNPIRWFVSNICKLSADLDKDDRDLSDFDFILSDLPLENVILIFYLDYDFSILINNRLVNRYIFTEIEHWGHSRVNYSLITNKREMPNWQKIIGSIWLHRLEITCNLGLPDATCNTPEDHQINIFLSWNMQNIVGTFHIFWF